MKNFKHLFGRRKGKLESWRVGGFERGRGFSFGGKGFGIRGAGCEVWDVDDQNNIYIII